MRYALFTGCVIPKKENSYEVSAKRVAEKLNMQLIDLEDTNCCGYLLDSIYHLGATVLALRILSLAEQTKCDLITLCNGCFGHLTRVNHELQENEGLLKKVNSILGDVDKKYEGTTHVKHFAQMLVQDVGVARIKETIVKLLTRLRIAPHWGCYIVS